MYNTRIQGVVAYIRIICINVKKTVVYTRVNGALHIENCKNYKKVLLPTIIIIIIKEQIKVT